MKNVIFLERKQLSGKIQKLYIYFDSDESCLLEVIVIGYQRGSPAYSHEKVQTFPFPDGPKLRREWIEQIGIVFPDGKMWPTLFEFTENNLIQFWDVKKK